MYNDAYFSLNRQLHYSKGKLRNVEIENDNLILNSKLMISEVAKFDIPKGYYKRYRMDFFGNIFIEDDNYIYLYDYNKFIAEVMLDKSIIKEYEILDYKVSENRIYIYALNKENYVIEYSIISRSVKKIVKTNETNIEIINQFKKSNLRFVKCHDRDDLTKVFSADEIRLLQDSEYIYEDKFEKFYQIKSNTIKIFERIKLFYDNEDSDIIIGEAFLPIINSSYKENEWYKLKIYTDIPEETSISIEYATFSKKILDNIGIINYKNLNEIEEVKFDKLISQLEFYKSEYFDEILLRGNGQFIIIKLKFNGRHTSSPIVDKIRIYHKSESYIKYLPEVYQNQKQRDFLERYLMIFESINDEIEEKVDQISKRFDLYKCDFFFLKYIAKWLSLDVDVTWNEEKLRNLLLEYKEIYDYRGTSKFLKRILEIYLDAEITIVENSSINYSSEELTSELKNILSQNFGEDNFNITILCSRKTQLSEKERNSISRIISNSVPPYCKYNFVELYNYLSLTNHTYLGINTKISDISELKLDDETILPFNTLLND
ncbi:MAG: phage tail protein [Acidaminobacteraceae bacterium]